MSSFKKLSKSDVTVVSYHANKQWLQNYCPYPATSDFLTIYKGTNVTGSFSLDEDPVTEGQYERLIYSQINHLFYQTYTASLNTSSLMYSLDNYQSASQQRPTSSYFVYNDSDNLITSFPTGALEGIRVIAINQNIYGEKILPGNFQISSSAYNVKDDQYGNLYDYSGSKTHIGNLFYAHGLGIITNQDYQLMFPLPPIAKNNTGSFLTTDTPKTISASLGDYARSGTLDTGSIVLYDSITGPGYSWATGSKGTVILTTSTPGTYTVYYTIGANIAGSCATQLRSNKAKITAVVAAPTTTTTTTTSTTTTTTTAAPTTTTTTTAAPTTTSTTTAAPTTSTTTAAPTTTSTTTAAPTTTSTTTTTTTAAPTTTSTTTTTTTAGLVSITSNNQAMFPYPVTTGNASSSGTISNTSGATVYVYIVFNSGGSSSGNIGSDSGVINGTSIPMSGTVTSSGQTINSTTYATITNGSTGLAWSLSKQDGIGNGSTLKLGYSTTVGGTINLLSL
jgi:hypothetical protein